MTLKHFFPDPPPHRVWVGRYLGMGRGAVVQCCPPILNGGLSKQAVLIGVAGAASALFLCPAMTRYYCCS